MATFTFTAGTNAGGDPFVEVFTAGQNYSVQPNDTNLVNLRISGDGLSGRFALTTPKGRWEFRRSDVIVAGSIAAPDVLNDAALEDKLRDLFIKADATGGGVSPGNAFELLRTNAAGNAVEWTPWLEATDISAQEYSLDFTDPTYTSRINKKFAGSKQKFLIEHYNTSTGAGGQLEITASDGEVTLRSIDDISNAESTLTLSTIQGAVFIDNNRADGQPLRVIKASLNNSATGITTILDNQSGQDFYIESIRYYPVSIVGAAFDGTCSIGTNVTADNEIEDFTPQVDFDDLLQSPGWNIGGLPTPATGVVLSTQTLGFNNKVADSTASSFQFNIVITGFYL